MMTATAGQMSCASSFFIWILSTDEPKDFRLPGTISVCQVRCGSIHLDFFQTLRCKRLADHSVQFLGLLFARTFVATDALKSPPKGCVFFDGLPNIAFLALPNDTPCSGVVVVVKLVAASSLKPNHVENILVGFVGRGEVESVVGVCHAPIITEPQAISSLGSDIFQIVCEASRRYLTAFDRRSDICS